MACNAACPRLNAKAYSSDAAWAGMPTGGSNANQPAAGICMRAQALPAVLKPAQAGGPAAAVLQAPIMPNNDA